MLRLKDHEKLIVSSTRLILLSMINVEISRFAILNKSNGGLEYIWEQAIDLNSEYNSDLY